MSKTAKLVISTVTAVAAAMGAAIGVHFGYSRKTAPEKTYRIRTENDALRVGVISISGRRNSVAICRYCR